MPASMHRFDLPRRQAFAYSSSGFVSVDFSMLKRLVKWSRIVDNSARPLPGSLPHATDAFSLLKKDQENKHVDDEKGWHDHRRYVERRAKEPSISSTMPLVVGVEKVDPAP
jgi:hypothetical protein